MAEPTPGSDKPASRVEIPAEAELNFELAARYAKKGPNPEYKAFEELVDIASFSSPWLSVQTDIWQFIEDAVEGKGGFVDGTYLIPFKREVKRRGGKIDDKFYERVAASDYDNFAKTICDGPWNYISQNRDAISRDTKDAELQAFWNDVDGNGTAMVDFLEYPVRQASMYGTGWIFMDRPNMGPDATIADSSAPENRPYIYGVPTRNVVDWVFDENYELQAVAILEHDGDDDEAKDDPTKCNLRVWTKTSFILFVKGDSDHYSVDLKRSGPNTLGEIPCVQLFNEYPGPGRGLGGTIMPAIARLARSHYNMRSEAREIQRKCAAFLAYPTKDLDAGSKLEIGSGSALPFNADAGKPEWVTPDLASLEHYREDMKATKESAFSMSHMSAISGFMETDQTSSGFHQQAVFDDTNKQIGKRAGGVEAAEVKLARLFQRMRGIGGEQPTPADEKKIKDSFSISYPREFGLRDMSAELNRLGKRLELEMGKADAEEAIFDFYQSAYPRADRKQLRARAQQSAADYYDSLAQANAANVVPMTPRDRAKAIATKAVNGETFSSKPKARPDVPAA
ncbi:MAG TPA: hypothetical protein PLB01_00260 [Thermoanaerobaculia bacterium]|nr:hypothetical protein [Thermoanaerobaculia bacterium]